MKHAHLQFIAAAVACLASGCLTSTEPPSDSTISCTSRDECPSDWACQRGRCVSPENLEEAQPCDSDAECDDSVFCNGPETCEGGFCLAGPAPCIAAFECVQSTCLETEATCAVEVDHAQCGPLNEGGELVATYCDPAAGCVRGEACQDEGDCADSSTCNGVERCVGFRCIAGIPPASNDDNECTIDVCIEPGGPANLPDSSRDGTPCNVEQSASSICLAGACVPSVCGDGFVDARFEDCEDGDQDPNDGCDACQETVWSPSVVAGLGESGGVPTALALEPRAVAFDRAGDLFVADYIAHRVWRVDADTNRIFAVAGTGEPGFSGDGGPAQHARLDRPYGVAVDNSGNVYISDHSNQRVRRVCIDGSGCERGTIDTVAGNGDFSFSGDGGPATNAAMRPPQGLAIDGRGNLFIADTGNHRVRRVCNDPFDPGGCVVGTIETFAGSTNGDSGDGGPATSAEMRSPYSVAFDADGHVLVVDRGAHRVRRVCQNAAVCTPGMITTVVGTGTGGFSGDGGPASNAQLNNPRGVATAPNGDIYIADGANYRIRRVCVSGEGCTIGNIDTIAGDGTSSTTGDGGPAIDAQLQMPAQVAVSPAGDVVFGSEIDPVLAETYRVRRICLSGEGCTLGHIDTIVGNGRRLPSGFSGTMTSRALSLATSVAIGPGGDIVVSEAGGLRIHRGCLSGVDCIPGQISVVAGTEPPASFDVIDDVPATEVGLAEPRGVAVDENGTIYYADPLLDLIRFVCGSGQSATCTPGHIGTLAGTGVEGYTGDGGPAALATFDDPWEVALSPGGDLYVAERGNHVIRKICLSGVGCTRGNIETAVGTGSAGSAGGNALAAELNLPSGIAFEPDGNLFIADTSNHVVRELCLNGDGCTIGQVTTVAGTGASGSSGDGGPASSAQLNAPLNVAVDGDGNLFIADFSNGQIRQVCLGGQGCTPGNIDTLAGGGAGTAVDGSVAAEVALSSTAGIAVNARGDVFFTEGFSRVLQVCRSGIDCTIGEIRTVIGTIDPVGDGAAAFSSLTGPNQLVVTSSVSGSELLLLTDGPQRRVRALDRGIGWLETRAGLEAGVLAEGAPARFSALLERPVGLALDAGTGALYVTESDGQVIRALSSTAPEATISTLAGERGVPGAVDSPGTPTFFGPSGIEVHRALGALLVADRGNDLVRAVNLGTGAVTTLVGTPGERGFFGDGVNASDALLLAPTAVAVAPDDGFYVADTGNQRVRHVDGSGIITTVTGTGLNANGTDGPRASEYPVSQPAGMTVDAAGNLFIAAGSRVRVVLAGEDGLATGEDSIVTIYGALANRFPESATRCLSDVGFGLANGEADESRLYALDSCAGYVLELTRNQR